LWYLHQQEATMQTTISDHGRINGSRITVHDVFYYLKRGRSHTEIGLILGLFPDEVRCAIGYIEQHKAEVEEVYRKAEERNARGNPPEIEAKLQESRAKMQAWREERQKANAYDPRVSGELIS
jgi:uncharacterized protein (DUF433 family)